MPQKQAARPPKPKSQSHKTQPSKKTHSEPSNSSTSTPQSLSPLTLPSSIQQAILTIYTHAFTPQASSTTTTNPSVDGPTSTPSLDEIKQTVQAVKRHLYDRNFDAAFGTEGFRRAYALRWSPGRAVGYAALFGEVDLLNLRCRGAEDRGRRGTETSERDECERSWEGTAESGNGVNGVEGEKEKENSCVRAESNENMKVVCLGAGGGAEMVALASYLRSSSQQRSLDGGWLSPPSDLDVTLVDAADWGCVTEELLASLTDSNSFNTTAMPNSSPNLSASFIQHDVLSLSTAEIEALFRGAQLVTIFFTFNELYTTSLSKTTAFLLQLTDVLQPGARVLVVDSAGSYATVPLGKGKGEEEKRDRGVRGERKYPMAWLLDRTLLVSAAVEDDGRDAGSGKREGEGEGKEGGKGGGRRARWEKEQCWDSRWFRLAEGLRYPLPLEDMRMQMGLYRRV